MTDMYNFPEASRFSFKTALGTLPERAPFYKLIQRIVLSMVEPSFARSSADLLIVGDDPLLAAVLAEVAIKKGLTVLIHKSMYSDVSDNNRDALHEYTSTYDDEIYYLICKELIIKQDDKPDIKILRKLCNSSGATRRALKTGYQYGKGPGVYRLFGKQLISDTMSRGFKDREILWPKKYHDEIDSRSKLHPLWSQLTHIPVVKFPNSEKVQIVDVGAVAVLTDVHNGINSTFKCPSLDMRVNIFEPNTSINEKRLKQISQAITWVKTLAS
ncbi:MAG: hypothetical protein V3T17_09170 [Pseudomonadales bacterium]